MKKIIAIVLSALMLSVILAACGGDETSKPDTSKPESSATVSDTSKPESSDASKEESKEESSEPEKSENLDMTATEVIDKINAITGVDQRYMMVSTTGISRNDFPTDDDYNNYIEMLFGTKDIAFKEAYVSMPGIGSTPYQLVVLKAEAGADIEALKAKISESANPNRWICVSADKVYVENIGDTVMFVMAKSLVADAVREAFLNVNVEGFEPTVSLPEQDPD